MKTLLKNCLLLDGKNTNVVVEDKYIRYIGDDKGVVDGNFDQTVDCKGNLLIPSLYNCHAHIAMTLFRGYGEDMPLDDWLNKKIFPAEDKLTNESVYNASMLSCAEMIRGGVGSFTDMYFFCDKTVQAVAESGMKANISRCIVAFDNNADFASDNRFAESRELFAQYNNCADGRVKIDMALHAEYTVVPGMVKAVSDYSADVGANIHIHLSETEKEHNECIARHGVTPAKFFEQNGAFDVPCTAAHCVWVTDEDLEIFKSHGVTVAHNPASNLKLGSGVMRLPKMLNSGINVTIGTDGAASNNRQSVLRDMYIAGILHKGITRDTVSVKANDIIKMATENGAKSQRRFDCGRIEVGCRADLALISLDDINTIPHYAPEYALVYSADDSNVVMNMIDGKILYKDGEYYTIDIEKVKYNMKNTVAHYFD